MISTDINRAEFTADDSATNYVFASDGSNIPVKEETHIKVYVTDTGTFTADNSTNIFTNVTVNGASNTSHGHVAGQVVKISGTTLPTGILANTDYYVRDVLTTTFKLSLASGGTAITITTDGASLTWTRTTLKVLNTDYSVDINTSNTATVTWLSGKVPLDDVNFFFLREVPYTQTTDLLNNSLIEAESLENQLDLIVNQIQQLKNTTERDLKFSDNLTSVNATDAQATLNVDSSDRANKSLKFDATGNLTVSSINTDKAEDYVLESKSYATQSPAVVNHYEGTIASAQSGVYSSKEHAVGNATPSSKNYATKVLHHQEDRQKIGLQKMMV